MRFGACCGRLCRVSGLRFNGGKGSASWRRKVIPPALLTCAPIYIAFFIDATAVLATRGAISSSFFPFPFPLAVFLFFGLASSLSYSSPSSLTLRFDAPAFMETSDTVAAETFAATTPSSTFAAPAAVDLVACRADLLRGAGHMVRTGRSPLFELRRGRRRVPGRSGAFESEALEETKANPDLGVLGVRGSASLSTRQGERGTWT